MRHKMRFSFLFSWKEKVNELAKQLTKKITFHRDKLPRKAMLIPRNVRHSSTHTPITPALGPTSIQRCFSYFWTGRKMLDQHLQYSCMGLSLSSCSAREKVGDAHNAGRGNSHEENPNGLKVCSIHYNTILSNKSWDKVGGRRDIHRYVIGPKEMLRVTEVCFPGNGWSSTCLSKVVNDFHLLL